jgi:hypothetical protein
MDIHCPTCGEPYEWYHLRYDEVYEWGLSAENEKAFLEDARFVGKNDPVRKAAERAGWQFATDSVFSFTHCPCCNKRSPLQNASQRRQDMALLAELLEGDEDGLIAFASDAFD